uniref:Ig-like domain-containing protein n=1 Tax=Paramormyrops kingsleyae TaxID=1676925 RepID=A0A3B3QC04_9TELE
LPLAVLAQLAVHSDFPPMSHSLQYVYSGTSGIWNLPEFMIVRLVDGEPFVHYDSNSHKMTPLQEWMAKSEGPDYWNTESQVAMSDELAFENNIEVAKQRFNQTGGIHTLQVMYSCEWDDETGVSVYGYDGSDFLTLDLKTMTYVAPVMQAVPTKLNWNSGRAFLEGQKAYHTHICIEWLKKYVSYGKSTLERTVRPEVSLLQKDPSSPVTCHATGFFPKGIVVTWRKDGVDMHSDVEVGETLPNGNQYNTNMYFCCRNKQRSFTSDHVGTNITQVFQTGWDDRLSSYKELSTVVQNEALKLRQSESYFRAR